MDLDTDFRRRMQALRASNPPLRTVAQQQSPLAPVTSANLPAPVIPKPIPTVQTVQKPVQQQAGPTFKQRADKGFDFFDANGNKTTIENYVKATGTNGSDLRKAMAGAGDAQSQKIVNAPAAPVQAKKPNFLEFLPQAANKFAQGVGGVFKSIFYDAPKTLIDQMNVSNQSGGSGALVDPKLVQNQIDFYNSEASKGTLTRQEADLMIKDLQANAAKATEKLQTAEKNTGVKADQGAGVWSLIDTASLATGIPAIIKELGKNGGKAAADQVVSAIEQQAGKKLTDQEKTLVAQEVDKVVEPELPAQDLEAIRQAGAQVPQQPVKPEVLPQEDINAILEAGAKAPEVKPVAATEALPESDLAAIKEAGAQVPTSNLTDVLPKTASELSKLAKNSFENAPEGIKPGGLERALGEIENASAKPVRVRRLENGDVVIEDGRHRLESARKNGFEDFPVEDVTDAYKTGKQVEDIKAAQTGDAGFIEDAGKTTSPDVAQADIKAKGDTSAENTANAVKSAEDTPQDQKLLNSVTDTTKSSKEGPGFIRNDFAHPQIEKITKRLNEIDNELTKVADGKKTLTREQITALKTERDDLIEAARSPFETDDIKLASGAKAKARKDTPKAEEVFPGLDEETRKGVQEIMDQLHVAENAAKNKTKKMSQEKAQRASAAREAYKTAGGGEEGVRAKMSKLKGKYSGSKYEPISVDKKTSDHLIDAIEKSDLRDFEKLNTQNALRKVWGASEDAPTKADVTYIRRFFNKQADGLGDELGEGIDKAIARGENWKDVVSKIAGLPRALMATGDFSGGFRQAMPAGTRHPILWAKALKDAAKWTFTPKGYEKAMKEMIDSDNFAVISDKLGVDLPGTGALADEGMFGAEYAEKIPLYGKAVQGFDRNYTGVLTKMRYDIASKLINKAGGADNYLKNMEALYGDKADDAMRALGEVINTFTGRGGKRGGILDQHMKTLSTTLFAPRLWAANLQRLNPQWYVSLAKRNPEAAKLALQQQGTFLATAGTVLGLAAAAGATVGLDPRSADFAKIKVGNTRYDILGGQQQNIVLGSRLLTGEKVNSDTGEVIKAGEDFGSKTRADFVTDMFENKSNPLLGFGLRLLGTHEEDGKLVDEYGEEFNIPVEVAKLGIPLGVQGAVDTSIDVGDPIKGIAMNAPSFVGVGVQTYGQVPTKDQGVDANGKVTFKGKAEPDMVTGPDGNVLLDKDGKVVRIKIDKDSTPIEIKALKDEKMRSTLRDNFVNEQSREDQALMKLSKDELKQYVAKGTITQAKADKIGSLNAKADATSKSPEPNAKSPMAKDFYASWNSKSEKEQQDWLTGKADDNAKKVADYVNAQRADGLAEYKPSNALSKLYAEYEKDINEHPEYTDVDKQNKARAFQVSASKLNYSQPQQDIYTEGGSSDLEALIDNGQIAKADLDAAIALDDMLNKAGITGSLKFSKKFRSTYGYGNPDGSSGSGGGSGGSSVANIASYLPSKTVNGSEKPTFSRAPRSQKIGFKTNLPKKAAGKKVTIKL